MQELESYVLSTTCQKRANDMRKAAELDAKGSFVSMHDPEILTSEPPLRSCRHLRRDSVEWLGLTTAYETRGLPNNAEVM